MSKYRHLLKTPEFPNWITLKIALFKAFVKLDACFLSTLDTNLCQLSSNNHKILHCEWSYQNLCKWSRPRPSCFTSLNTRLILWIQKSTFSLETGFEVHRYKIKVVRNGTLMRTTTLLPTFNLALGFPRLDHSRDAHFNNSLLKCRIQTSPGPHFSKSFFFTPSSG